MSKKAIRDLVMFALSDKANLHRKVSLGQITSKQVKAIKEHTNKDFEGVERFLDTSFIRHVLKNHGSIKKEESRGQVAVNIDDFELIPKILANSEEIIYKGKNKQKMDVFEYRYKVGDIYVVLEELRENKYGKATYISTMYKVKGKKR